MMERCLDIETVWPLTHAPYTLYQPIQPYTHGETFASRGRFSDLYSKGFVSNLDSNVDYTDSFFLCFAERASQ